MDTTTATADLALEAAALEHVRPGSVIALGTGPLLEGFVEALAAKKGRVEAIVAATRSTAGWLETLACPSLI